MTTNRKKVLCVAVSMVLLTLMFVKPLRAESTFIVDTPTKGMLDYASYDVGFRFFSNGGVLSRLNFGVFRVVNLGVGWELGRAIGAQSVVVGPPTLYLKIRPFTGGMILPAFAFGYDGQGYYYDKDSGSFSQKERGLFLLFGRELLAPGLNFNIGVNMSDFKGGDLYGFTNFEWNIEEQLMLLAELDNVNSWDESRVNAGVRFFITEDLSVDMAGRDIASSVRPAERIAQVKYIGRF